MPLPNDAVSIAELTVVEQVGIPEVTGARGPRGYALEVQTSATHVQWRAANGLDDPWQDLVALADLTGPQGAPGADGSDGAAGADGTDGREVEFQVSATHIQWRLTGDVAWTDLIALATITGPAGADGSDGADGAPGVDGADGAPGSDGADGADGAAATVTVGTVTTGAPGSAADVVNSGTSSAAVLQFTIPRGDTGAPGADGADGVDGAPGAPGADGADGADGLGWTGASYNPADGTVTFTSTDGLGFQTGDLRGADGSDGIGVPDPSAAPAGQVPVTDGAGAYALDDLPVAPVESTVTLDTVDGDGTFTFPALASVYRIAYSGAARLRLYRTAAGRDADAARAVDTAYPGGRGRVYEYVALAAETDEGEAFIIDRATGESGLFYRVDGGPVTVTMIVKET